MSYLTACGLHFPLFSNRCPTSLSNAGTQQHRQNHRRSVELNYRQHPYLQAGDKIPADGIVIEGAIKVDQAALNGETEEADKITLPADTDYDIKDLLNKYYAYRGTVVCGGEAYMEIKVVGDKTLFGELALEVQEDARETPLQVKLGKLAKQISTFGYVGAIAIVIGVMSKTLLTGNMPNGVFEWIRLIMDTLKAGIFTCSD